MLVLHNTNFEKFENEKFSILSHLFLRAVKEFFKPIEVLVTSENFKHNGTKNSDLEKAKEWGYV